MLHDLALALADLAAFLDGDLRRPQLLLHISKRQLPVFLAGHLPLLQGHLCLASAALDTFQSFDLTVHVIHVRQERKVSALEMNEDLHDFLDIRDPGPLLDRPKCLLEDLDALLMLLDMAPLDAVQESRLHDPAHHARLREFLLLGRQDQLVLPLHAALSLFQAHLHLPLVQLHHPDVLPYLQDFLGKGSPLIVPLPPHHLYALLRFTRDCLALCRLLNEVADLRTAAPNLVLQPLEDKGQLLLPLPDLLNLLL
mmetsp:Transcript_52251/g.122744  ORF Transcript_52251/g.122744 Transcript_52251/m.122744 type:complete len:254 (+) Transcript_52251:181-942(+)